LPGIGYLKQVYRKIMSEQRLIQSLSRTEYKLFKQAKQIIFISLALQLRSQLQ
jgi:hypothetical protein